MLIVIICAALAATLSVASSLNRDCTEPPTYPHAKLEKTSTSHGSIATYIFEDPFKLIGNLRIKCVFGEWKYMPNCEDGRCYVKDLTDSSHISLEETPPYIKSGKRIPVICEAGYSPVDSSPYCRDGAWKRNSQSPCQSGFLGVRAKSTGNTSTSATADNDEETIAARCSPPKCDIPCRINFNAKPCPECQCGPIIIDEQCFLPKCEDWCQINLEAEPCPVCECDNRLSGVRAKSPRKTSIKKPSVDVEKPATAVSIDDNDKDNVAARCSSPKCDIPCRIDFNAKPCPACQCGPNIIGEQCSLPKCEDWCQINFETKPCPVCECGNRLSGVRAKSPSTEKPSVNVEKGSTAVSIDDNDKDTVAARCSPLKCDIPCRINFNAKPCPACQCGPIIIGEQCFLPKCEDGCQINFETTPCPVCECDNRLSDVRAKSPGNTSPEKPSVNVEKGAIAVSFNDNGEDTVAARCSPLKCDIPCQINFNAKPCPACQCGPIIIGEQCSLPKCEDGCQINFETKPCPVCECDNKLSGVRTKPPGNTSPEKPSVNEDKGATAVSIDDNDIDTVAARCPSPKCDIPCRINFNAIPCPVCQCGPIIIGEECSLPKCEDWCPIDFETKPCPICECDNRLSGVRAKSPGNTSNESPSVNVEKGATAVSIDDNDKDIVAARCSPPNCEIPCRINFNAKPCPACQCGPNIIGEQCSVPKCEDWCQINFETKLCPVCECDNSIQV